MVFIFNLTIIYIETKGVSLSISAIKTPTSAIKRVNSRARYGSPAQFEANIFKNGITSSTAIACSNRGAPITKIE